jgi:hypothetical protein
MYKIKSKTDSNFLISIFELSLVSLLFRFYLRLHNSVENFISIQRKMIIEIRFFSNHYKYILVINFYFKQNNKKGYPLTRLSLISFKYG